MNVIIVEDEINAFEYLSHLLETHSKSIEIVAHVDSVKGAVELFNDPPDHDLIFMDIQLADGMSFEIFHHVDITQPIIFTTAFDQYALEAFKVHSVDYLLKPISSDDLTNALTKYDDFFKTDTRDLTGAMERLTSSLPTQKKNRCLVKKGGHFEYVNVTDISHIYSEEGITFIHHREGQRYVYSKTIEQFIIELDPVSFFQINRSQIVNVQSIVEIHPFLNQRYKLLLSNVGSSEKDFIVSRQRGGEFKKWMDR